MCYRYDCRSGCKVVRYKFCAQKSKKIFIHIFVGNARYVHYSFTDILRSARTLHHDIILLFKVVGTGQVCTSIDMLGLIRTAARTDIQVLMDISNGRLYGSLMLPLRVILSSFRIQLFALFTVHLAQVVVARRRIDCSI